MLCRRKKKNPSPLLLNVAGYSRFAKSRLASIPRDSLALVTCGARRAEPTETSAVQADNLRRTRQYVASNRADVFRPRHASTLCSSRNAGSSFDGLLNCGSVRPAMNNTRFDGKYLHVRQALNSVTLAVRRSRYDENCYFARQVYLGASLISGGCLPKSTQQK